MRTAITVLWVCLVGGAAFAESHADLAGEDRDSPADVHGEARPGPNSLVPVIGPSQRIEVQRRPGAALETVELIPYADRDLGPDTIVIVASHDPNGNMTDFANRAANDHRATVRQVSTMADLRAVSELVRSRLNANPGHPPNVIFAMHGVPGMVRVADDKDGAEGLWIWQQNAAEIGALFRGVSRIRFQSCEFGRDPATMQTIAQAAGAPVVASDSTVWSHPGQSYMERGSNWVVARPTGSIRNQPSPDGAWLAAKPAEDSPTAREAVAALPPAAEIAPPRVAARSVSNSTAPPAGSPHAAVENGAPATSAPLREETSGALKQLFVQSSPLVSSKQKSVSPSVGNALDSLTWALHYRTGTQETH